MLHNVKRLYKDIWIATYKDITFSYHSGGRLEVPVRLDGKRYLFLEQKMSVSHIGF